MNAAHLTPMLDTCEALKRAGFPQNTVFSWSSQTGQFRPPTVAPRHAASERCTEEHAAPTLTEVLAYLPSELAFSLPHPIFGATDRRHTLEIRMGHRTVIGYHIAGSREVQHRTEDVSAVEAAARLYLALHAAGRLRPSRALEPMRSEVVVEAESLAQAA